MFWTTFETYNYLNCFLIKRAQQGKEKWHRSRKLKEKRVKLKGDSREKWVKQQQKKGKRFHQITWLLEQLEKNVFKLWNTACYWHHQWPSKTQGRKQKNCHASFLTVLIYTCCWDSPAGSGSCLSGKEVLLCFILKASKRSCAMTTEWPCVHWTEGHPFHWVQSYFLLIFTRLIQVFFSCWGGGLVAWGF